MCARFTSASMPSYTSSCSLAIWKTTARRNPDACNPLVHSSFERLAGVGAAEGAGVGAAEGAGVGTTVGAKVGVCVGAGDATAMKNALDSEIHNARLIRPPSGIGLPIIHE